MIYDHEHEGFIEWEALKGVANSLATHDNLLYPQQDTNFFNYILLNNVTDTGFVATCGAAAQNDHVKAMWISWVAIPGA